MSKFKRPKDNDRGGGSSPPTSINKIVEGKCHTCRHKERDRIDYMLAMKTPYVEIHRLYPELSAKSIGNHAKEHLSFEDEGVKRIIEHEAGIAQENLDAGLHGVFMRRTVLDMAIKKAVDAIASGEVTIEIKDLPKMIELREKLDANSATAQIEQYELQFNAFKAAVEELTPPDVWYKILDKTKEILMSSENGQLPSG